MATAIALEVNGRSVTVTVDDPQMPLLYALRNQIEGNVAQTVSRTLKEQVIFDRSRVTSLDWASYPILTFPEIPAVDIELVDRPTDKPWGAGEPAAAVVLAAIQAGS